MTEARTRTEQISKLKIGEPIPFGFKPKGFVSLYIEFENEIILVSSREVSYGYTIFAMRYEEKQKVPNYILSNVYIENADLSYIFTKTHESEFSLLWASLGNVRFK